MPRQHNKLVNLRCLIEVACCCPLPRHPRSLVRTGTNARVRRERGGGPRRLPGVARRRGDALARGGVLRRGGFRAAVGRDVLRVRPGSSPFAVPIPTLVLRRGVEEVRVRSAGEGQRRALRRGVSILESSLVYFRK